MIDVPADNSGSSIADEKPSFVDVQTDVELLGQELNTEVRHIVNAIQILELQFDAKKRKQGKIAKKIGLQVIREGGYNPKLQDAGRKLIEEMQDLSEKINDLIEIARTKICFSIVKIIGKEALSALEQEELSAFMDTYLCAHRKCRTKNTSSYEDEDKEDPGKQG